MPTRVVVLLSIPALLVACKGSSGTGPSTPSSPQLQFSVPAQLTATRGVPFTYSFCRPPLTTNGELCQQGTTPTGGQPPYHFQYDTAAASAPPGLNLSLNGILSGTPSAAGQSFFRVCAVDLAGANVCLPVTMTVNAPPLANLSFRYSCTTRTEPFRTMTCTGTADFELNVTVPGGFITVTMPYGSDSGESPFRGTANVSSREGGPGAVHIDNFALNNYTGACVPRYNSVFRVYGGVLNQNPPVLASTDVTGTTTCN